MRQRYPDFQPETFREERPIQNTGIKRLIEDEPLNSINNEDIPVYNRNTQSRGGSQNPHPLLSGRNSFNAIRVNKFKKNFNKRWNNEHPSDPVHVNEYVPIAEHNYAANIAAWKTRNTTKNKTYKTRANYNANSRANDPNIS
jgi:hypothetical protein